MGVSEYGCQPCAGGVSLRLNGFRAEDVHSLMLL